MFLVVLTDGVDVFLILILILMFRIVHVYSNLHHSQSSSLSPHSFISPSSTSFPLPKTYPPCPLPHPPPPPPSPLRPNPNQMPPHQPPHPPPPLLYPKPRLIHPRRPAPIQRLSQHRHNLPNKHIRQHLRPWPDHSGRKRGLEAEGEDGLDVAVVLAAEGVVGGQQGPVAEGGEVVDKGGGGGGEDVEEGGGVEGFGGDEEGELVGGVWEGFCDADPGVVCEEEGEVEGAGRGVRWVLLGWWGYLLTLG